DGGHGHGGVIQTGGHGGDWGHASTVVSATAQGGCPPPCPGPGCHKHKGHCVVADPCHWCGGKGCSHCAKGGHGGLGGLCSLCGGLCGGACAKARGLCAHLLGHDKIEWFNGAGGPVPLTPGYTPYVNVTRSPRDFLAFPPFVP